MVGGVLALAIAPPLPRAAKSARGSVAPRALRIADVRRPDEAMRRDVLRGRRPKIRWLNFSTPLRRYRLGWTDAAWRLFAIAMNSSEMGALANARRGTACPVPP